MYALALIRYRRPLEEVVVHQDAHRAFQRKLQDEGQLLAAGPHDPRFGGMMLLRVGDEGAQKALDAIATPIRTIRTASCSTSCCPGTW